jgi:vacuolar iron transporter family protein
MRTRHTERHRHGVINWLRAAVLGANDGIVSTASLLIGMATAGASQNTLFVAALAALVSGAMAMAAGEYISVHSQADTEAADLARERGELNHDAMAEERELAAIYVSRGLQPGLAQTVAQQLMAHDALGAHARDELGFSESLAAKPMQAAVASAASFAAGASLPLALISFVPRTSIVLALVVTSVLCLAALGALAAHVGGAPRLRAALRVSLWGAAAMGFTAAVGSLL